MAQLEEAVAAYERTIAPAVPYLLSRGFTKETAEKFRLGYVQHPVNAVHQKYRGRLGIPYLTPAGPTSIKFRCLAEHDCKETGCPKYLGLDGSEPRLFNTNALIEDCSTLYVLEGELDAISVTQVGLCAIGYPGTGSWDPVFTRAIGPDWDRVVVVADSGTAGRNAAKKVAKELGGECLFLSDDADDCNAVLVSQGPAALRRMLGAE